MKEVSRTSFADGTAVVVVECQSCGETASVAVKPQEQLFDAAKLAAASHECSGKRKK